MKKLLLLCVLAICVSSVFAQKISYQGEVALGYGVGVGDKATDRIPIHLINGVRFNEYLFVGIGVGVEYYCYYKKFMSESTYIVPVFANIKGYLPVSKTVSPFLSLDFGYGAGVGAFSGLGGVLFTPAVGVNFKVSQGFGINFSVGYAYQQMKESTLFSKNNDNAISIKVGFQF